MPALVDRENISDNMQEALRKHIVKEREKRQQEKAEAEKDHERRLREEEEKRKREAHSVSLEEVKDQLTSLKEKLEQLKQEKHRHFIQFKKVLHEEEKRKSKLRDNEMQQPFSQPVNSLSVHHMIPQAGRFQTNHQIPPSFIANPHGNVNSASQMALHQRTPSNPSLLGHQANRISQSLKRPHSPSSPKPSMFMRSAHPTSIQNHSSLQQNHDAFQISGHSSPVFLTQSPGSHSIPSHYASQYQKSKTLSHEGQQLSGAHANPEFGNNSKLIGNRGQVQSSPYSIPIGKQLEQASLQSGFGEDSLATRQRSIRMLPQPILQTQGPFGINHHVRSPSPNVQIKTEKTSGHSPSPSHSQQALKYYHGQQRD